MLSQMKPPFRAEQIGSLLRPPGAARPARQIRARRDRPGGADRRPRTRRSRTRSALQQRVGLKFATDGEFRRRSYHSFFYRQLGDISIDTVGGEDAKGGHAGRRVSQPVALINSRVRWTHPINVPDFEFIRANTSAGSEDHHPRPLRAAFSRRRRGGAGARLQGRRAVLGRHGGGVRPGARRARRRPAAATCRSTRRRSPSSAIPRCSNRSTARGDDWSALIDKYIAVTNRVLKNAPAGMRIGMHLCRGNRGGQWHSEGSYDDVADRLFNALNIPFYFLEYDSPRAGTFTPLRLVPKHKTVVLGIVSTKTPAMENKDEMQAARRGRGAPSRSRQSRGQPAMRLRQRRHRQSDHAGGAGAEAAAGGGAGERHLGRRHEQPGSNRMMQDFDDRSRWHGADARPAVRRDRAGRRLADAAGAADRGRGPRRQSRRAGAASGRQVRLRLRQAVRGREHAGRGRHRRRQPGGEDLARRPRADVRRFRRDGDQSRAQPEPRLRPDQGFHADHRAGDAADHPGGPSRRAGRRRSTSSSRSPRRSPAR